MSTLPEARKFSKIHLSNEEIELHGCKNCLWLIHDQCKSGYSLSSQSYHPDGICQQYLMFLFSFAEEGDSSSAMWEKFMLYQSRLQSLEDYREFKKLELEIMNFKRDHGSNLNNDYLKQLEMKKNMLRMFWSNLHDQVIKSLGKIVDREKKVNIDTVPRLTVQQLNVMISDSAEKLLNYEKSKDVKE